MIVAAERKVLSARSHKHEDKLVRLGKHDDRDTTISERPLKISALVVQDLQMSKKCPFLFHSHVLCFMSFNIPLIGTKHRLSLSPNVIEDCFNCFKQHVSMFLPLNIKKARQRCSWSTTSGGSSAFHSNGSLAMNQNQAKSSQVNES